ncbi:hypothetical protein SESBI_05568 [Sesbania bispinosa]|nr:hypothetical protein SESBI_05568 [Sesbania bispinosa]
MPLDPAAANGTTTVASRPISPLPHPHAHHHYSSPQQQQQQQQTLPIHAPNPPLAKPLDPSHHFLYPFTSSARGGFVPKGVGADHAIPGYPPPSLVYSHGVRGMHLDYLSHALHVTRPLPHVQFPHLPHAPLAATASPPVKGHPKVSTLKKLFAVLNFVKWVG